MKTMLLLMERRRTILDTLYESISSHLPQCDVFRLDEAQQQNLAGFFRDHAPSGYDRVVIYSRLKRLKGQVRVLSFVPGLVFFEYDAWQNYASEDKRFGQYSKFYRALPGCRVISSGCGVSRRLRSEGIDARFVPKGFDDRVITDLGRERDIFAAFLGSTNNQSYAARRRTLEAIGEGFPLEVTRTNPGGDYAEMLNRIRVFVSVDTGMGEYMLKNFESMAAGCVLLAQDQGAEENEAVGFKDMENVVLYRSAEEAVERLKMLRDSPELCDRLAAAGRRHANEHFTFSRLGELIALAIAAPMPAAKAPPFFDRLIARIKYPWMLRCVH
ncbi:glycosyltransferase family protein [Pseudothauera rhizosphaerae]|uniref:Glycosyltransferase family 1 protein n=1 Tax=Pseudothauera rhizosphaerae TaxID=2565932 RepID=A0A4S4AEZ6_9RHOO|nr:glycosyltransferase [Pseudothauera rhizosphaerae]THF57643.1 glycosyltransferase family 1 protein [Pseudothauera rhizosphaerae]